MSRSSSPIFHVPLQIILAQTVRRENQVLAEVDRKSCVACSLLPCSKLYGIRGHLGLHTAL